MWEFQEPLRGNFSLERDLPVKLAGLEASGLAPPEEDRYTFSSLSLFGGAAEVGVVL